MEVYGYLLHFSAALCVSVSRDQMTWWSGSRTLGFGSPGTNLLSFILLNSSAAKRNFLCILERPLASFLCVGGVLYGISWVFFHVSWWFSLGSH